jgi:hypothetical protein
VQEKNYRPRAIMPTLIRSEIYAIPTRISTLHTVTCFESHSSVVAFPGQRIWNFVGNRLVEAHIHDNEQDRVTELVEIDISFSFLS